MAEERNMEPRECFYRDQFGYCWLEGEQWIFRAGEPGAQPVDEPIEVNLEDLTFHHDDDEELH